ncbi:phage tail protein [Rhizobium sp. CSW-27]|uniref:host specificity protein J n=1 Tax=Rhizobium sp. CSW-27 TaxID=2839985 RepID=UPI001C01AC1A|nr:phage tail protein [Rhizobium sp. CSW-27]MBT9370267.1 phage tail protein [Rhizobium sp. CSW-27]
MPPIAVTHVPVPDTVPVLAAPLIDPGARRVELDLPAGLTIAEIIQRALPKATLDDIRHMRVVLLSDAGCAAVEPAHWTRVRPKPGVRVVIRIVPGKNALRSILQIVVSIAAVALGQYWAAGFFAAGTTGFAITSALIGIGVSVLGNLLINALIPPQTPKDRNGNPTYSITGWRNRQEPNGVLPDVAGKIRFAPPFVAPPYSEIVGDVQYLRCILGLGIGPVTISGIQVGDTALTEYDEFQVETREGLSTDAPISLYPSQVVEESVGAELARPLPRNDIGEVISGPAKETPVIRTTGPDASGASIILGFSAGLGRVDNDGNVKTVTVAFRIRQRPAGAGDDAWQTVETLSITSSKLEGFFRQYTWNFATRGRYEIEVTRMTDETTSTQVQSRSSWVALQTLRPEYPLNIAKPMALIGLRIKATYQINGQLDNVNALASRRCLDYDHTTGTWIERETSNPASIYRLALQSAANPRPVSDAGLDLGQLEDWHDFCRLKGLKYDRVHEEENAQLRDVLTQIASAGRALPRHDGVRWGVVIDRPQTLAVDHINSRNSWQFKASRTYIDPPHAFRVSFQDATNDYKPAERIVPWPGHSGAITKTEALELPGKTDPAEIWREARRRMYEAIYRADVYTCLQDGLVRVATRGDLVMLNTDVLERMQSSARVKSVMGRAIELDNDVSMLAGQSYAMRFRVFADESDTIGYSVVRAIVTQPGQHRLVLLDAVGTQLPAVGDLVQFGPALAESFPVVVTRVEAGRDFTSTFRMVDAAPIIDELTDEEVPPAWTGRVGAEIDSGDILPPAPVFTSVRTGVSGAGEAGSFIATLVPGSGAVVTAKYRLQHRLSGASVWTTVEFPAADGGITVGGYVTGNPVQMRAAAIAPDGTVGNYTTVITVTIGATDAALPAAIDDASVSTAAFLGSAAIIFSTSADSATTQVRVYRSTNSTLDSGDPVVATLDVTPSRSYTVLDGDTTRVTLLPNGSFGDASAWSLGTGWSIADGLATHAPGTASSIVDSVSMVAGKYYRLAFRVLDLVAGTLTPQLQGGSAVSGVARSANGLYSDRLLAAGGSTALGFLASSAFEGSLDDVVLFEETATCLSAGTHYYFIQPLNADGVGGPVSGPHPVVIR